MDKKEIKKVVLAYSGGLDTSIIIPWLKANYNNPEIIAVAGNVGQADELEGLEAKALATGASKLIVADLVDEMVDEIIIPSLKMDAKYETYLLGTAFARPVIGRKLAQIALEEGADAIVHGATVGDNVLIGMHATLLNGCVIGENSIVAAGALVKEGQVVPPNSLAVGVPARIIPYVNEERAQQNRSTAQHYVAMGQRHKRACSPASL